MSLLIPIFLFGLSTLISRVLDTRLTLHISISRISLIWLTPYVFHLNNQNFPSFHHYIWLLGLYPSSYNNSILSNFHITFELNPPLLINLFIESHHGFSGWHLIVFYLKSFFTPLNTCIIIPIILISFYSPLVAHSHVLPFTGTEIGNRGRAYPLPCLLNLLLLLDGNFCLSLK